jgi:exopolysaccharide biosynthesis protein
MYIFTFLLSLSIAIIPESIIAQGWKQLAPGMDLQNITSKNHDTSGYSHITLLRIDPELWELVFIGINQTGEASGKTARDWCKSNKLTVAINGGMFAEDNRKHVGYLRVKEHVYVGHINSYQSVMAFDPKKGKEVPRFRIFDLDGSGITMQSILNDYSSAVQNLRLIKKPGKNQWSVQNEEWSEAAIGEDKEGRILFIYSRSPLSMHVLNQELLTSGIGIVAAQHLEGGFEAQFYLNQGDVEIDLFDSFDANSNEGKGNAEAWPIPNIIGIRPRKQVENTH